MKIYSVKCLFLVCLSACMTIQFVDAQTKKKVTPKRTTTRPATTRPAANTQVLDATVAPMKVDTAKPAPVAPPKDPFAFDTVRNSWGRDAAVERNLNKSRTPLMYEHIREDDAWYRERVWREIDIREKMNLAFRYKADDDNGSQQFINILLRSIKNGGVTAFDPNIDDRFTTPMTLEKVGKAISGRCDTIQVIDWTKDPDGSKGIMKDSLVCKEFNPDDIKKFRIKEEWVFDKESSRMVTRILGIAPIKTFLDDQGNFLGEAPMFWVYYPDLRPALAQYEVYNGKNFGARMSWEELFESRYFASNIIKSSIENPYDMFIKQYFKDGIMQLLEGENIKNKIFNFEQDLWSF